MTLTDLLPRIVTPYGAVVMPGEIESIDIVRQVVYTKTAWYPLEGARFDRPTGLRDKTRTEEHPKGKMIYENDIMRDRFGVDYTITWDTEEDRFIGVSDSHVLRLNRGLDAEYISIITGMLPYSET